MNIKPFSIIFNWLEAVDSSQDMFYTYLDRHLQASPQTCSLDSNFQRKISIMENFKSNPVLIIEETQMHDIAQFKKTKNQDS